MPFIAIRSVRRWQSTKRSTDLLRKTLKGIRTIEKHVYYFGVPIHENLGDAAQMFCIRKWIKDFYPDYQLVEIESYPTYKKEIRNLLEEKITPQDIIINESGATFCNRHHDHGMHRYILKTFINNKIIFMPQTVDLTDVGEMEITAQLFNQNNHALFIARDPESYKMVLEHFDNNRILLFPDIVTTLIGQLTFNTKRNGILVCKRIDAEKKFTDESLEDLMSKLKVISDKVDITDTNFDYNLEYTYNNLEKILKDKFNLFAEYDVVITDRYHGMIFSLISNTPVVVLPTTGHKVREGAIWLKQDYPQSIYFCETPEEAFLKVKEIVRNELRIDNKSIYKEKYFNQLFDIINYRLSEN